MNLQEAHSSEERREFLRCFGTKRTRAQVLQGLRCNAFLAPKKRRLSFARKIALFSIYFIDEANARIEALLKSAAQINNWF